MPALVSGLCTLNPTKVCFFAVDLEGLDSSKVYVIGGIVDLTINKV